MSWLIPSIPSWSRSTPSSSSTLANTGLHSEKSGGTALDRDSQGQRNAADHVKGAPEEEEEGEEKDIDAPPPFPLLDSHQRAKTKAPPATLSSIPTPSFSIAPPSPTKSSAGDGDDDDGRPPPSDLNIAIVDSPLGNMAPPPSTTKKPSFGLQVGGDQSEPTPVSTSASVSASTSAAAAPPVLVRAISGSSRTALGLAPPPKSKLGANRSKAGDSSPPVMKGKKGKVALTPGHSALDWARLTCSGEDLRGVQGFQRVTLAELKEHNTPDDAWSVFNGMVYNITPYIPFHPGGEKELMRVAGRDGTKLFMLTHSWVNLDFMLKECLVGVLVRG
ncbi:hypothetical protein IAU59_003420 [Kwoniella sp. CBS 9459]